MKYVNRERRAAGTGLSWLILVIEARQRMSCLSAHRLINYEVSPRTSTRHHAAFLSCFIFRKCCSRCIGSSHMTASSSASWSKFSPPSNFVNGHVSIMWFMVCRLPASQEGDWARPHLRKLARQTVYQRPCMTREIETWLSDSRVGNNSVVDHRSRRSVLSPLRNCVDRCHV